MSSSPWWSCASCQRRLGRKRCPISGQLGQCPFSPKTLAKKCSDKAPLLGGAPASAADAKDVSTERKALTKVEKLLRRGSDLALTEQFVYAEMSFSKAIELDASDWRGHYGKALAIYGQGRSLAALSCCRAALEKASTCQPLLEMQEFLAAGAAETSLPAPDLEPKARTGAKGASSDDEEGSEAASTTEANPETSPRGESEASAATAVAASPSPSPPLHAARTSEPEATSKVALASADGAPPPCPGAVAPADAPQLPSDLQPGAAWQGKLPSKEERQGLKNLFLQVFREQWERIGREKATMGYSFNSDDQKSGLTIQGGHRPMARPEGVAIPKDFREPVGQLSAEQLEAHNCESSRLLLSLHGDIFDVSDRPDKYGKDGPYYYLTGHDITWGLVSGQDSEETVNKFYDLFKCDESSRQKKLQCICSWIAFYETEYGAPVGRLLEYEAEDALPPPPEIGEQCSIQ
mmetsp:Transcript_51597/g.122781  ORF Transcript_51597/g.122781 Transcript_51597/m.122781 type:complete len:464 (-) Transcript_51597:31-1422(-)